MAWFLLAFVLGFIPAMIASSKGYNFFLWWLYGFVLFIIALVHALLLKPKGIRQCPHCAEDVKPGAIICPHCRQNIATQESELQKKEDEEANEVRGGMAIVLVVLAIGAGLFFIMRGPSNHLSNTESASALASDTATISKADDTKCQAAIKRAGNLGYMPKDMVPMTGSEVAISEGWSCTDSTQAWRIEYRQCNTGGEACVRLKAVQHLTDGRYALFHQ